ncbi:IS110 family transposase [Nocardioides glacieisoli]|uniref:IS110 family transposase n=1 Tax=Nocardioides glacieisoli TaxID=1168730 RepID=A0A4Q2RIX9_9ACTN|nr:IS110 family transposase [Nocardioides glacieisoli]RYB88238.1 IS110 family transposase [Nocardioides glacieisoli]
MVVQAVPVCSSTVVVAIDVGKTEFAFSVTDASRALLLKPRTGCPMTGSSLTRVVADIVDVLRVGAMVKVGIEAAGHYHRPLLHAAWPDGWEVLELNPAHVTEQRRVLGKRTIKTDVIDLQAMTELLLAGRGQPVRDRSLALGELTAWSAHRTGRVAIRTATKNQLLGQLDRTFPGLTLALPDVLATKVGRLVATEFPDPARLTALGSTRFIRFGATRGLQIRKPVADRIVQAAREALPAADAAVARAVLAADLALLSDLDAQVDQATDQLARILPSTPFASLMSVPGWAAVRAGNYGGALGDPTRFDNHRQVYRTAGLNPIQYESAGKRHDSVISREGSVELRRALIDLGMGLWLNDPAAKAYGAQLRARGKKGGVIACAMANRANRIAYALVRDQNTYDPARWLKED